MNSGVLTFPARALAPHLIPREDPLTYTHPDTWDASTPEELHRASWGVWMRDVLRISQGRGFAIALTTQASPPLEDTLWRVTPRGFGDPSMRSLLVRRIQDGRARRCRLRAVFGLPEGSVFRLAYAPVAAPVLWAPQGSLAAVVLPPMGPSAPVNLSDALEVSEALGGGYYTEVLLRDRPALRLWRDHYGWNPIPEFRRAFEREARD